MPRYALIDAAARPDTPQAIRYYTQGFQARSLFANQPEAQHADFGPWLAELDGNPALDDWLRALDLHPGAVARLEAPADFRQVFGHLESCLDLSLSDGSQAVFRFWDGRVLARLLHLLTVDQKRDLLGPIESWQVKLGPRVLDLRQTDLKERPA